MKHICPVCGYPDLTEAIYTSGKGPSYEICPSCGYEFGFSDWDSGITYEQWRAQWIGSGNEWTPGKMSWSDGAPPLGWDPKKQLENIGIYL